MYLDQNDIPITQNSRSEKPPSQNWLKSSFSSWKSLLRAGFQFELNRKRKLKLRKEMTSRKSHIPGYPEVIFTQSANDQRLPGPVETGPPFIKREPGKLSFRIGPLNFRHLVFDGDRNRNEPFVLKPGRLSFRLGPIIFRQVPTDQLNLSCCTHRDANCWVLAGCGQDFAF